MSVGEAGEIVSENSSTKRTMAEAIADPQSGDQWRKADGSAVFEVHHITEIEGEAWVCFGGVGELGGRRKRLDDFKSRLESENALFVESEFPAVQR